MFFVIYKWEIKPGMETAFIEAWGERTEEIKNEAGGLGSRLHKSEDNCYIAYAKWPSREIWKGNVGSPSKPSQASQVMKEATASFEIVHTMELVKDLLD